MSIPTITFEELKDIGLTIKNIYYLSETFFNNDEDEIAYTKNKIILQHLIGLKLDGNKFSKNFFFRKMFI
mgnify:CR=1 FL=1